MFWVWDRRATLLMEMENMHFLVLSMMAFMACGAQKDEDTGTDDDASSTGWGDGETDGGGNDGGTGGGTGGGESGAGDADGGEDADTTTGRFLGQMNAETYTVYEAGEAGGVDYDAGSNWGLCSGGISFDLGADMKFEGAAGCSSYVDPSFEPEDPTIDPNNQSPYTMNFDISGIQADGTVEGMLVLEVQGEEVQTPFTGSRDGLDIEASFDSVHGEGGNRFEISGTLTATWVE